MQIGIGHGDANGNGLRHREIHEALTQFVVGLALHAPLEQLGAVRRIGIARPEHHERRPPEAIERLLDHRLLFGRTVGEHRADLVALTLVEVFFLANADHGAGIRAIRGLGEHRLVHDRGAVDQPADHTHVRPRQRGIVEDAGVLRPTVEQGFDQVVAIDAERFRAAVDVQPMPGLVLHLGDERHLPTQRRCAGDPVAFRQHADDFGMRVLRHHPGQLLAVALRHPVLRLDAFASGDTRFEGREEGRIFGGDGRVLVHREIYPP